MINKVLFSKDSDNWRTPSNFYNFLMANDFIDCFPYCSSDDQYEKQYSNQKLFINPPYSHLNSDKFRRYIKTLYDNNNHIILLIPSRTDTWTFHFLLSKCYKVFLIWGRLHFNDSKRPAPFPSCLIFLDKTYKKICCTPYLEYGLLTDFVEGLTLL